MRKAALIKFPYRATERAATALTPLPTLCRLRAIGLFMKTQIETVPHGSQRDPTVGDYSDDEAGVEQVRVSEMPDWRYETLVAVHEMVERILVKH